MYVKEVIENSVILSFSSSSCGISERRTGKQACSVTHLKQKVLFLVLWLTGKKIFLYQEDVKWDGSYPSGVPLRYKLLLEVNRLLTSLKVKEVKSLLIHHCWSVQSEPSDLSKELKWNKMWVTQSCLSDPIDHSLPDSSVYGILQTRMLECIVIACSRGSFWPRDRTWVSHIAGRFLTIWATRKALVRNQLQTFSWRNKSKEEGIMGQANEGRWRLVDSLSWGWKKTIGRLSSWSDS